MIKSEHYFENLIFRLKKELAAETAFLKWSETFSKELQPILNDIVYAIKKEPNKPVDSSTKTITKQIEDKYKKKVKIKISATTYKEIETFVAAYTIYLFSTKSNKDIKDEKTIDPVTKAFSHWLHSLPGIMKPDLDSILRISFMEIKPGVERRYKGKSLDEYYEQIRSYGEEMYKQAIDFLCNYSDYHETVFEEDD